MKWPGIVSIRSKLIWLTTAISVAAILVVTAFTAWHAYESRSAALRQELTAVGGILSANLEASLVFGDARAAKETLSTLTSRPLVVYARLLDRDGTVFATHGTLAPGLEWPDRGFRKLDQYGLLTLDVEHAGRDLGKLQLCATLSQLDAAVWEILLISGAVMIGAAVIAWLLARLLGQAISRPIEHLATTMQRVSADHDFGARAVRSSDDEVGTLIDGFNEMIATIQRYHDDLAEARDRAEHANRSKTQFLATMSHELRTPLNAILGFSEVLGSGMLGDLSQRYRSYGHDIHTSAQYLMNLINDLLDMSRMDSGGYTIREEEVAISTLVADSQAMIQPQAQTKRIAVGAQLATVGTRLLADDRGLRQVILNLVGNAVKFTPAGGRIEIRDQFDDAGGYVLTVADNGPGIPKEDLERVLEPFEQVRSHLSREHGGTGLGLAISRAIVEAHGGRLSLESVLGEGTVARVQIPAARVILARCEAPADAAPGAA